MTYTKNMPPLLELDVLRSFVAIAECGSFSKAALLVFRSPGAVSIQIKRLEETLGQRLFIREARQVRLTQEGETLLTFARRLLKLNEETVSHFLKPELEGTVTFGLPNDVGTRILPAVLAQFARSHPAVSVNVEVRNSQELIEKIQMKTLDVALITMDDASQVPRHSQALYSEPLLWTTCESGLAAKQIPLPIAVAKPGCCWRKQALDALEKSEVAYRIAYTCDNCTSMKAAMEADLAVAPLPRSLVKPPFVVVEHLPKLDDYQVLMLKKENSGPATNILEAYIAAHCRDV
ncbi:LysR family transcriptional regulator [Vibrio salinus]|uniref:LysR family transcriptional regulator n=1 Tax=Vibrio salinus TaxID=2899784 RepID=UPI001E51DDC7|nr:LysR family transcriptional regulator [Vibrio salinus]MCE0496026.1 LysR family transcriptional regulator [Vibrio salinus]